MKRLTTAQRPDWETTVHNQGLIYATTTAPDGSTFNYWGEGNYYTLTAADIDTLELAANELFEMKIEAGDYIIAHPEIMRKMAIPEFAWPQIIKTWNDDPACQSVYARFDFRFGGVSHPTKSLRVPQMFEDNADTPTGALETGYVQWAWLEDTKLGNDQFNSLQEKLVGAWKRNLELLEARLGHKPIVHFACVSDREDPSGEDMMNTLYLEDACRQAGYDTRTIYMENIKLGDDGRFYDQEGMHIDVIFKLYPWEFMVEQEYGRACFADMENIGLRNDAGEYIGGTVWIEPPYKMLWSNKGILAVLWKLFGGTDRAKYLIPAWFEDEAPAWLKNYVKKPLLSREGANVTVYKDGEVVFAAEGEYGAEGHIVQRLAPPPEFVTPEGKKVYPVIGGWMVDGEPAGMCIREESGIVTTNQSQFIPHCISDSRTTLIKPRQRQRRTVMYTVPNPTRDQATTAREATTP
ncbi:MAG TPA: glutathionylspermidine synthase family protein [Candidatus Saccharimonadales bacterium]|jgi:glutathionylspermidine synthase